ncbi:MAG: phosphoribosyltransferase family protein [Actinomycetota bacterium]
MFTDRSDAGARLASLIAERVEPPAVVLGIPRGGAIVAGRAAALLGWPLDLVVTKKLGAPGNPELGIGAVAPGVRIIDQEVIRVLGISDEWLDEETARVVAEVDRRTDAFRAGSRAIFSGQTAVIVDDGVATGGTARAAGMWARGRGAVRVVLAVPAAPPGVERRVGDAFDVVLALERPADFLAVGQCYRDFTQVSDEEVHAAMWPYTA